MPMRIQVIFGETSLLVPCGDGKLTVGELIEKSVTRFKKVITKHPEDVVEVRSLRLADSGSFVDEDDEVADVLEDKETVILDYEYYPHQDSTSLHNVSISDDSAIVGTSSQPFSPNNLDTDHTHFSSDVPALPSLSDKDYREEGVSVGETDNLPSEGGSQEEEEEEDHVTPPHHISQDLGHLDPSQDQGDLTNHNWHSLMASSSQSQEHSPHLNRKSAPSWRTNGGPTTRDPVLDSQDSGYAPTKSQESYGQSKSQEAYPTDLSFHHSPSSQGQGDAPGQINYSTTTATVAQLSSEGVGSQTNLSRVPKTHDTSKEEVQPKSIFNNSGRTSLFNKPQDSRFGQRSLRGDTGHDMSLRGRDGPHAPPRGQEYHRGAMDIPGHFGRPNSFAGYSNSYSDNRSHTLPHNVDEGGFHDRALRPHEQWRRSMHTGDYNPYHDMSPYGGGGQRYGDFQNDPFHYQGGSARFPRPHDSLPAHFQGNRRGDFRNSRTLSHERLDQAPPYGGWGRPINYGRPGIEEDPNAPVDYFLSQPNPSYVNFDRPGNFPGGGPPHLNPINNYDPRFTMNGPSGVSLSQPGMMLSHGGGRGMFDHDRRGGPWGSNRMQRGGGGRSESGRGYTVEEEFDHLDEEDELDRESSHGGKGRGRPSPFQRDSRKSMFRDGPLYSQWMERMYEHGIEDDTSELPEYDNSQSQRSRTPSPTEHTSQTKGGVGSQEEHTHGEDESDEDDEFGNIHIVELHKGEEPLGVYLTHYTSPDGRDLGVFIGDMDNNGFAAKSGKLKHQDRILACNGVDFTKELTNARVEEIFTQMSTEPLLRMAISRGLQTNLLYPEASNVQQKEGEESVGVASDGGVKDESMLSVDGTPGTPKIVSNLSQPPSLAVTNTRQIGIKHTIKLTKLSPTSSLGFGVTSRDVMTDNKNVPFYVKGINSGTPAFNDGRLKIGDRLLQVNGNEVTGMSRPEVVALLRQSRGEVTIIISRQEVVDEQEAEEFPSSSNSSTNAPAASVIPQATTVGKSVLTLTIPLSNSGSAGLGVTVYGRTTLSTARKTGDMGIYIKSIVPGGAAALDGRLKKNDQILCVNRENLLGGSNQEALDKLRSALSEASSSSVEAIGGSVELVVARRVHSPGSSMSPSMAALGEEPEEDDVDKGREIGIDVPIEAPPLTSPQLDVPSLNSQGSTEGRQIDRLISQTSLTEAETLRSSIRERNRAATFSVANASTGVRFKEQERVSTREPIGRSASPLLQRMKRAEDALGSGEFDRLEPLNPSCSSPRSPRSPRHRTGRRDLEHSTELRNRPTTPQSPLTMQDKLTSWYEDAAASVLTAQPMDTRMRTASLDRSKTRDYSSQDYRGVRRTHNHLSESAGNYQPKGFADHAEMGGAVRHRPPQMSRDYSGSGSQRSVVSPTDIDMQLASSGQSSREVNLQRTQYSPRHEQYHSNQYRYPSNQPMFPSYSGDSAPTRGSGRKDRNKPERGSGRHQTSHYSSSSSSVSPSVSLMMSPDVTGGITLANGFSTVPRSGSRGSERGSIAGQSFNAETSSLCSLEHLRLSDSESNAAFRRDEPGRISITKKTKKNPRRDFAHMRLNNVEPLVEGEAPVLIRTGSDSCLNDSAQASILQHSLQGMEFGPQLGLVKSSSLESLHNVMHHTIKRDIVIDNRELRNSFRRAVDRSYDSDTTPRPTGDEEEGEQRGVDVPFDLEDSASVPAVMSFTKNPNKAKKSGFFKKVFRKRGKSTNKKERPVSISTPQSLHQHKRGNSLDVILDQDNFSPAEKELLRTGFTIPVRLGDDSVQDIRVPGDHRYGDNESQPTSVPQRHSMPILDDYDCPSSPDEALLSTMAKV